jgi:potassium-transporting ATPase KdpC subunit
MNELRPALTVFVLLSLLTGVVYPIVITGIGQAVFGAQANGSVLEFGERAVGSRLIGQAFSSPQYFWSRPSATGPHAYNGAVSSGSNQGPLNPALEDAVRSRIAALRAADPTNTTSVPVDLVTASGSGLDPHISPAAAEYQVARVARERKIAEDDVRKLVAEATEGRALGILGEPRVNVLELNLLLDAPE